MALDNADRDRLVAHIATLLDENELHTLAKELRLSPPSGTWPGEAPLDLARFMVERATQISLTKSLLKSVLRRFPEDEIIRGALKRDPRFTGVATSEHNTAPIAAALKLRGALMPWGPTHVLPLEAALTPFAALVAGDGAALLSSRLAKGDVVEGLDKDARLLLVRGDGTQELAQALLAHGQGRSLDLRIVTGMVI